MKKFIALLMSILIPTFCMAEYYSQCMQDQFVHENYFLNKRDGVFIDIGAHDGISLSNTYFFEKNLGWKGICIEPIPEVFAALQGNRTCSCLQGCIGAKNERGAPFLRISGPLEMFSGLINKYDPQHLSRIERELKEYGGTCKLIKVDCYRLNDLLEMNGLTHVDFMSIDTEGGELEILKSIDFDKFQIDVITVENNYKDPELACFMLSKNYAHVRSLEWDELFVSFKFNP